MIDSSLDQEFLSFVNETKPRTVEAAVDAFSNESGRDKEEVLGLIFGLVKSGKLPVKGEFRVHSPSGILHSVVKKLPFLGRDAPILKEPQVRSCAVILFFMVLGWFLITVFHESEVLLPFRVFFLGVDFLFMPGFSLLLIWYPINTATLDFTKLDARNNSKSDGNDDGSGTINTISRITFSTCISLAIIVLVGAILPINILLMNVILSSVKILSILYIVIHINKLKDPYRGI
ncbi:MAG: hypothetical protein ACTSUE_12445 [Promethearchaeota archaeon]